MRDSPVACQRPANRPASKVLKSTSRTWSPLGWLLFASTIAFATNSVAQSNSPGADLAFEVASIKRHVSGADYQLEVLPGGRLRAINSLIPILIQSAYQLPSYRVVGGPSWMSEMGFDINAKAPDSAVPYPRHAVMEMLRSLLRERFALRTHEETRDTPVYVLRVARSDRKLGPNLRPATTDCEKYYAEERARTRGTRITQPPEGPYCGLMIEMNGGAYRFKYGSKTMSEIAAALSQYTERPVIDGTGLSGLFDLDLLFTPDNMTPFPGVQNTDDRQSLPTALSQSGLRLESRRGQIQMLVIDSIEPPSED